MNGIHDLGGMHGMGPIQYEKDEPVFHQSWESRIFALARPMAAWRKWSLDASRYEREQLPAADYLRTSYYEKWLAGLIRLLVKADLVTQEEIETGTPTPGLPKQIPPLTADKVQAFLARGAPASRDVAVAARFQAGQPVRARNINPVSHTRLPRYARGKPGTITRDHGVFVFPDTNALFLGEKPQHVYSVRFLARDLWGDEAAPQDTVYLDLFDDYLEPA